MTGTAWSLPFDPASLSALFPLAIAVFFLVRGVRLIRSDRHLRRVGRRAVGHVGRIIERPKADQLVIRFADAQGRMHEFVSDIAVPSGTVALGGPASVLYDPQRPEHAQVADQPGSRSFSKALLLVGAAVAAGVAVAMWRSPP